MLLASVVEFPSCPRTAALTKVYTYHMIKNLKLYFIKSAQSAWLTNSLHVTLPNEEVEFKLEVLGLKIYNSVGKQHRNAALELSQVYCCF